MRMYPEQDGRSVVPDLAGPVAILDNQHNVRVCVVCVNAGVRLRCHVCAFSVDVRTELRSAGEPVACDELTGVARPAVACLVRG